MLNTTLKFTFRNLKKNKMFTFFSMISLSLGFTCCMFAYLYVTHEMSYDTFIEHSSQIIRMGYNGSSQSGESQEYATLPQYFLPAQFGSIPEIKSHTRLAPLPNLFLAAENKNKIEENKAFAVESTFFDVFNFTILRGDTKAPLSKPNSIVLTRQAAQKYFGDTKAVGKVLEINYGQHNLSLTVTAVMQDVPSNSHLDFTLLIDSRTFEQLFRRKITEAYTAYEYLLLSKDTNIQEIQNKLTDIKPELKSAPNYQFSYTLLPITKIHLHSSARAEIKPTSDIIYVYFFFAIALIILIVSSINYMSLFLSHSADRFEEMGIRKSMGAYNSQLIGQLLLESVFISLLSLILAFALAYWVLPIFNVLTGKSFMFSELISIEMIGKSGVLAAIIGLVTSIYPAWSLTKGPNINVLGNSTGSLNSNIGFQHAIVVLQFTTSIILIISTIVVFNQISFIQHKDLGFNKDRIVTADNSLGGNLSAFRDILSNDANIQQITASSYVPGTSETGGTGPVTLLENGKEITCNWVAVDYNFFDTFEIDVIEGRSFSKDFATDSSNAFMINRAAAEAFGLKNPVGKQINTFNRTGKIIGVTNNFNYLSLHQQVPPMIFFINKDYYFSLSIKLAENTSFSSSIQNIKKAWGSVEPNIPFDYSFLENQYQNLYQSERHMGNSFFAFSIIAIIISCLGLFSLTAYTVQRKTKEIGIRKVLGATTASILQLFYGRFFKLISLSYLIAIPISYWVLYKWLANFAYKTSIGVSPFAITLIITCLLTTIAISYWTLKAAFKNPVDSIKTE